MKKLPLLLLMIMGTSCVESKDANMSLTQVVENRRSIRSYTNERVDRSTLESIVRIGAFAPSSYGQNPVDFVIVEDKERLKAMARAKRIGAPSVSSATAAIVVMADTTQGELWVEDASVAAGYILLAAEEQGLGACWNQIRNRDGQHKSASDEIKEILHIPSRYEILCVIALGYKAEQKKGRTDSEQKVQQRTHFENY